MTTQTIKLISIIASLSIAGDRTFIKAEDKDGNTYESEGEGSHLYEMYQNSATEFNQLAFDSFSQNSYTLFEY